MSHATVRNITRGIRIKRTQAVRRIERFQSAWVEHGKSIRDLTLAESIAFRNKQARDREPLAPAELPWITDTNSTHLSRLLAFEANEFVRVEMA